MAGPTIYLFEDDAGLRGLLLELLQDELSACVVECRNIGDLLERCATKPPDLIVADFWGASHLRLSDAEREQVVRLGKVAPTVLVSARHWAQDAGPEELGLVAVVSKPLDLDTFVTLLRQTLVVVDDETASELPQRDALSVVVLGFSG